MSFGGTDRYEVIRQLGEGGFGAVYEVRDRQRDTTVALKTLLRLDPVALYRFKREFRALAGMRHPNIVELHELGCADDVWFYTMELVDGVEWTEDLRLAEATVAMRCVSVDAPTAERDAARPMVDELVDLERLRDRLEQLVDAVQWLHSSDVIHRDLKPSNVLVTTEGRVVVVDFGIATDAASQKLSITQERSLIVGTPEYMAPEQCASKPVTAAADWYAVGTMLYESLTGTLPFTGSSFRLILDKTRFDAIPPSDIALGIPEDLEELCLAMLARDAETRPRGAEIARRLGLRPLERRGAAGDAVVVGRSAELTVLKDAFEQTKAGHPRQILIEGTSGIGKSALAQAFLDHVAAEDALVLRGRCYERELVPFNAFDEAVDQLSRALLLEPRMSFRGPVPPNAALLTRLFPVLGRVPLLADAPSPAGQLGAAEKRARACSALRAILHTIAEQRAVVLHLEDFQWADRDSTRLLVELAQANDAPPILIVVTYRSDVHDGRRTFDALIWRLPTADRMVLDALPPPAAVDLAARLMNVARAHRMARQVAAESRGNPYFLRELAHLASQLEGGVSVAGMRLESVIAARVRQLEDRAREVLEVIVLAGRPIDRELIRSAAGSTGDELERALRSLSHALLVRKVGRGEQVAYEAYHDRSRRAVLETLSRKRLLEAHAALADALDAAGVAQTDPERLLAHLERAGQDARAARLAREAAHRAREALAFDHAVTLLRKAVRLWPEDDDEQLRAVRWEVAEAFESAGQGVAAADRYLELVEGESPHHRLEGRRRAAEQLMAAGHLERGMEVIRDVLAELGETLPTTKRATLGVIWELLRRWAGGVDYRARESIDVPERERLTCDVYRSLGQSLFFVDPLRGKLYNLKALRTALALGDEVRIVRQLAVEATLRVGEAGDREPVEPKLLGRARSIAERLDDPVASGYCEFASWMIRYWRGEFAVAAEELEGSRETVRSLPFNTVELNIHRTFQLFTLRQLGEYAEVGARGDELFRDARQRGDHFATCSITSITTLSRLAAGKADEAEEALEANPWVAADEIGGRESDVPNYWHLHARAQLALHRGDLDAARELLPAYERVRRSLLCRMPTVLGEVVWTMARLHLLIDGAAGVPVARKLQRGFRYMVCAKAWSAALDVAIARTEDSGWTESLAALAHHAKEASLPGLEALALHLAGEERGTKAMVEAGVVDPDRFARIFVPRS